jgi:hypothetical protein
VYILRSLCKALSLCTILLVVAAEAPAGNIVPNPGFETPNPSLGLPNYFTSLTTVAEGVPTSADAWFMKNQLTTTFITTELLPSTDTINPPGTYMIHVVTNGTYNGIAPQLTTHIQQGSASVDVFVLSGRVYLTLNTLDGGAALLPAIYSSKHGEWERLQTPLLSAPDPILHPITSINIYADVGGADYYVDNAAVVPEPSALALLAIGIGAYVLVVRRRPFCHGMSVAYDRFFHDASELR